MLPGWGHQYAQGGSWRGRATFFALADAALWTGLVATLWQRSHAINGYESLAVTRADAQIDGKDRQFFLNIGAYRSSDEFQEAVLRNRAWDQVNYVSDPAFQWAWQSDEDFFRYRGLREDAESLGRRRTFLIAGLVANRVISGISAAISASRQRPNAVALSVSPTSTSAPQLNLYLRF